MTLLLALAVGVVIAAAPSVSDGGPSPDAVWRNDFSDPKTLEKDWKFDGGRFMVPRTRFSIGDEPSASKGKVMVVEAKKSTGVMLAAPSPVNLEKTPIMRWRWRIVRPLTIEPGKKEPDDQAVVIYFGDGTLLSQKCVGYRWEVNTPLGSKGLTKYAAGMMTVSHQTVRNGTTPPGEWVVEERDVVADYKKAYNKMPNTYFIISVGANSQYSGSDSRAEIDFIEFIPRRKAETKPE